MDKFEEWLEEIGEDMYKDLGLIPNSKVISWLNLAFNAGHYFGGEATEGAEQ